MSKIKYNGDSKNSIINSLNVCLDTLSTINNSFYNTYIPYGFYYKNTLANLESSLIEDKEDLSNYKNNINKCMEDLNKNELEIMSKLNKIEEVIIEKF